MPDDKPQGVFIPMTDIYDQLILIKDSVRDLKISVDAYKQENQDIKKEAVDRNKDFETRIRSLEAWKYGLPLTAILGLVSLIVTAYTAFGGK